MPSLVKSVLERLSNRSKAFKVTVCFCLLGLVTTIDYATGVEISVSAFYPIPVVLAARIAGEPGLSIRPVFFWNATMELAVYAGLALALARQRPVFPRVPRSRRLQIGQ
jgi:hypothetical protein